MKRFAAVANAGASHQMTMCAIGRELQKFGHEFLLVGTAFQAQQLRLSDIPFQIVGGSGADPAQRYVAAAKTAKELPLSATLEYMTGMAGLLAAELPPLFRSRHIDFILADQEEPGAATAADLARLPYASICSSLPLNEEPDIPPGFLSWPYSRAFSAKLRNRLGYAIRNIVIGPVNKVLNVHRRAAGLPLYRKPDDSFSPRAQISQLVKEFDFPHQSPVPALYYVGPFHRHALSPVDFPYGRLNGQPLIYASFGTSFGNRLAEMRLISEVCAQLPVQLVLSLGGSDLTPEYNGFPGQPIIVSYAPQHELIARSALTITHGGLNTTMEALSLGIPLLAMPIAGDQLGVGSRIAWHGVGKTLAPKQRTCAKILTGIRSLLHDQTYTEKARTLAAAISRSGGPAEAAAILHRVATSESFAQ